MRLTPTGLGVLGAAATLHLVGWSLGYAELLVIATAGLLAVGLALTTTLWRPRLALERRVVPSRVVKGDPAEARLTITNLGRHSLAPQLVHDRVGDRVVTARLPRVAAAGTTRAGYPLPTARRGVVDVGPLEVVRTGLLGLSQRSLRLGEVETLWVYPRIHPVAPLPSGHRRDLEGVTHDGASGSITFHALREYATGDDLRLIHWRSTARTGTLMVRQQADPSQPRTTIVLDTQRGSYRGEAFEAAVEAAASLVVASTGRRFPVRLLVGGTVLTSGSGGGPAAPSSTTGLLQRLTTLQPTDGGSLAPAAGRLATEPGGTSLVVVTGRPDRDDVLALQTLVGRYATMAFVRFLPGESPGLARDGGLVDVRAPDAESFTRLWNEIT